VAFVWSKEAVERLNALHAQGLSGSELASRFGGGLTRSAIFGKLHRLGLTGAKRASRQWSSALAAAQAAFGPDACGDLGHPVRGTGPMRFNFARNGLNQRRSHEGCRLSSFRASSRLRPPPSLRLGILDLGDGQCRFIDGEDGLACGHPVATGSSWCPAHHAVVFVEEAA
jgi:hypothetical protein